jgi:hypothetical protein
MWADDVWFFCGVERVWRGEWGGGREGEGCGCGGAEGY